jgi:antitoxin component YwqK of YwqJK toxin-antitoxin module
MNRRIFICTFCIFISLFCKSQLYQYTYYLDYNLGSTEKARAVILGKGFREDSLFRLDCFAMTGKKPYMSFHFKDSSLSDLRGPFVSYHSNGRIENQGNYWNAYEEGIWQRWDSAGRKVDSIIYKEGIKMVSSNYRYGKGHPPEFYTFKDSLNDLYENISYDENGKISFEAYFTGNWGILKTHHKDGSISSDSVFSRDLVTAP